MLSKLPIIYSIYTAQLRTHWRGKLHSYDYNYRSQPRLCDFQVSVVTAMLPRNVRKASALITSTRHLQRATRRPSVPPSAYRVAASSSTQSWGHARNFASSSRRQNEIPKSPFQTFVDTLKEELHKNRQLQENVKQLQGDVDKLQDSEALKKARDAYERARVCTISY